MIPELCIESAGAHHTEGLTRLFRLSTAGCYCRFWHFSGWENAWLERCQHPHENAAELARGLATAEQDTAGLVALAGTETIGWLKLGPVATMRKLYERRPYAKMKCFGGDRTRVYVVGCVLVAPGWRRRGVAHALVRAAVEAAATSGATAIEALPRAGVDDPQLLQMGPFTCFVAAGFEVVNDEIVGYPVMRRALAQGSMGNITLL